MRPRPVLLDDDLPGPVCRVCGCTDDDCSGCVERTDAPCHWVETDLCSACAQELPPALWIARQATRDADEMPRTAFGRLP